MKRRPTWAISLLFAAGVVLLVACQKAPTATGDADPHGDLDQLDPHGALVIFWHTLTGADRELLLELVDDFNVANPWDISVVGEDQENWHMLASRIDADLATRQVPNLILADPDQVASYALKEAIIELTPYLDHEKWGISAIERDDFFSLESGPLDSFPTCRSLQVLYYNVDWLKELDREAPPQTWDAFRDIACAASNPDEGRYGFEFGMDPTLYTSLLTSQNIPLLNVRATRYTLGGQQGRAALQFLDELIGSGCAVWETEEGPVADFGAGQVPFIVGWTDDLTAVRDAVLQGAKFEWSLAPLPHTTEEAFIGVRGPNLAVLRTTPKGQLAAWLFVKWLSEPEQQARWAEHIACFPIRRSALDEMSDYLAEHPEVNLAVELLEEKWVFEPALANYTACRAEIGRMLYAVTAGESVDQWFNDTLTRCNQALSDATP